MLNKRLTTCIRQFSYNPPPTQQLEHNPMATVPHGHLHPTRLTTSLEPLNRLSTVPPPSVKRMPPPPPPSRVLNSQSRLDGSHPTHGVPSQQSLPSSRPSKLWRASGTPLLAVIQLPVVSHNPVPSLRAFHKVEDNPIQRYNH